MCDINVNRSVANPNYCYKMPLIRVGKTSNEIKTIVVNVCEIATALNRPAQYLTSYFGYELGTRAQFDERNARFTINGAHDATTLQELLDGFIRAYVLCPECDNPETKLGVVAKHDTISITCKLCFYYGLLRLQHKLNMFILKNPPMYMEKPQTKQTKPTKPSNYFDEKTEKDRMYIFHEYIKRVKAAKDRMYILHEYTERISAYDSAVYDVALRLEVTQKAPLILVELLFTANILIEIKRYRELLFHFTNNDEMAQRHLLCGVGQIIALHAETLIDKVGGILRLLYDYLLSDTVILDWYTSDGLAANIREKATPFIEWLNP